MVFFSLLYFAFNTHNLSFLTVHKHTIDTLPVPCIPNGIPVLLFKNLKYAFLLLSSNIFTSYVFLHYKFFFFFFFVPLLDSWLQLWPNGIFFFRRSLSNICSGSKKIYKVDEKVKNIQINRTNRTNRNKVCIYRDFVCSACEYESSLCFFLLFLFIYFFFLSLNTKIQWHSAVGRTGTKCRVLLLLFTYVIIISSNRCSMEPESNKIERKFEKKELNGRKRKKNSNFYFIDVKFNFVLSNQLNNWLPKCYNDYVSINGPISIFAILYYKWTLVPTHSSVGHIEK